MKQFFAALAAVLLVSLSSYAQISNDFESGSRDTYAADCWIFYGTSVSATDAISGTYSVRSGNHTNNSPGNWRQVYTPFLEFSGVHTISVSHSRTGGADLIFEIILTDKNENEEVVYTRSGYPAGAIYNETVNLNRTGRFRVLFRTRPASASTARLILDDISIDAQDVADRNSLNHPENPRPYCDCLQEPPVAADDIVSLDEDTFRVIDILANDTDADGDLDPATVTITQAPSYGTATVDPVTGEITYTPDADFFGNDQLRYEVSDGYPYGDPNKDEALVSLTILGINDAPTSADRTITINENETYTFSGADFIYNDVDGDCFNGFKIVTELTPDLGELLYDGDPVILDFIYADPDLLQFVPTPQTSGTTEFDFRVVDDQGAESPDYTMTIHILGINDAPSAEDIVITMPWNTIHDFTTELVYTDPENDPMGGFMITALPGKGSLTFNNSPAVTGILYDDFSLLAYEPETNEHGSPYTTFTLVVQDDQDAQSEQVLVTINVLFEAYEIQVSEGFSPNGDDINDLWYIRNIERFPGNKIQIYNRWGNLVRSIEGYDNETRAWRGESDNSTFGREVADGSYFYIISLGDGSEPLQGYVVLHR